MADFDERSGIVACPTPWGFWYQTLDEISIEISVAPETRSSQVHVQLRENQLFVTINGDKLIQGELFNSVRKNGLIWTLETDRDGKVLRIVLAKMDKSSVNTWHSLLKDNYCADPWLLENMRKKAALERIQLENPGFDMSSAEVTGDYATGGPDIPC